MERFITAPVWWKAKPIGSRDTQRANGSEPRLSSAATKMVSPDIETAPREPRSGRLAANGWVVICWALN